MWVMSLRNSNAAWESKPKSENQNKRADSQGQKCHACAKVNTGGKGF